MSRLPIRLRLTAVFAVAMAVVLTGAGLFVYDHLRENLDDEITATLRARLAAPDTATGDPEEAFTQVLGADGGVLRGTGDARGPALAAGEVRDVLGGEDFEADRKVDDIEGTARVLAERAARGGDAGGVVVAGQSLNDRNDALHGLVRSLLAGGPIAVLLASALGYALAAAALKPVEAMRRRAAAVSLGPGDEERLPLPEARDEVRRLGETLNAMLARLRVAFDRERRFVADASHELRTPIAVVKTELEGILRGGELPSDAREALEAALAETEVLAQLAEDLLVLARAGDGKLPLRLEAVDARQALERTAERFGDRAARAGRDIEVRAPAGLAVRADPLRLRQAVGNLVDNALRHGSGTVVLEAARADGGVDLCVRDAGAGVPEDLGDRAFERFTRGPAARTLGGAGLGLAIVRAIAEAHGGQVALTPGVPRTVRLWLPDPSALRVAGARAAS